MRVSRDNVRIGEGRRKSVFRMICQIGSAFLPGVMKYSDALPVRLAVSPRGLRDIGDMGLGVSTSKTCRPYREKRSPHTVMPFLAAGF
jgi:hypothetical protein